MIVKGKMSKTPRPMISLKTAAYNPTHSGKSLKVKNHNTIVFNHYRPVI